jgi:nucleotide-binding universal stress UspA family protein
MLKVLVPIDGSENALRALRHVVSPQSVCRPPEEIHLLNVQPPVASGIVRMFVSKADLQAFYNEEGGQALAAAREELERAGVPFHSEVGVGDSGATIVRYAREKGCAFISMGTRGMGSVTGVFMGSVAAKVVSLADRPVLLVK